MHAMFRTMIAMTTGGLMALSPLVALADTTIGVYQTTDRKMDYELRHCGADESRLCVRLLAARGSALTGKVKPWVGRDVVSDARATGANRWKGKLQYAGHTVDGTLKLMPGEKFVMSGCTMVVLCADITLIPALD